ncbi:bidirectional sugar transporter SWEET1-like [Syzygium oleosum]|uniref:bidirectional sugar transporter SWEET1-like n=1 Tax=Syzygium oleosum TaxID=219896 RepID=UPI0024BB7148|nr:bidirectional sugar transporter SWEET1-like [Syzygium oleosum]
MGLLRFTVGIFGNVTALLMYLAPTITFRRIVRSRSTEQFSGVPYVITLLNCLLYCWYGLPFVSPNNLLLSTITGIGAVIEFTYVLVFVIYAPKKERTKILVLVALAVAIFSTVALISFFVFHGKTRKLFAGVFVDIFAVAMFASPLSVMRLVIKTESVEFMPFFLSLFGLLCAVSWSIFGLINRDPFVIVPNALGSGLGVAQMSLYAMYHKRKHQHDNVVKDGSLETDLQMPHEKQRPKTHQLEHGRSQNL